jgi:hypothetical protein
MCREIVDNVNSDSDCDVFLTFSYFTVRCLGEPQNVCFYGDKSERI